MKTLKELREAKECLLEHIGEAEKNCNDIAIKSFELAVELIDNEIRLVQVSKRVK